MELRNYGREELQSVEELEAKMKKILDDYSQIIDVTPEVKEIKES